MNTDDLAAKGKDAVNKAANSVEGAIGGAAESATQATRRAKAHAEEAIDYGHDAVDYSQDFVQGALRCAAQMIRDRPITSMAIVGMIGYIWGRVR